jgi:hypothetical protein
MYVSRRGGNDIARTDGLVIVNVEAKIVSLCNIVRIVN